MRLQIAAIGGKPGASETALISDYLKRANAIGRNIGFTGPEISALEAPRNLAGEKRQLREGALLLDATTGAANLIALDEKGQNLSSEKLARLIGQWRDDGVGHTAFAIGGADGHAQSVLDRATIKLSFGALTWPHMLVRVMLAEQIYRVMTILSGHPYHRS